MVDQTKVFPLDNKVFSLVNSDNYNTGEAILECLKQGLIQDTVLVVRPSGTRLFCSDQYRSQLLGACQEQQIPLERVPISGCRGILSVPTMTGIQVFTGGLKIPLEFMQAIILNILKYFGLEGSTEPGKLEIWLGEKVIGGTSQTFLHGVNRLASHIYFDYDNQLAEALGIPNAQLATSIKSLIGDVTAAEVSASVVYAFSKVFHAGLQVATPDELEVIHQHLQTDEDWRKHRKWSPVKEYWRPQ